MSDLERYQSTRAPNAYRQCHYLVWILTVIAITANCGQNRKVTSCGLTWTGTSDLTNVFRRLPGIEKTDALKVDLTNTLQQIQLDLYDNGIKKVLFHT